MPCQETLHSEMNELLDLDPKRLKTMEPVSVNSSENTVLYFATPSADNKSPEEFFESLTGHQPAFTYPFFGQEEVWKGVSEGELVICFDPRSFYAFVSLEVDEEAEELKKDILSKVTDLMPKHGWTTSWDKFVQFCTSYEVELKEIGQVQDQFQLDGSNFSILSCNFENAKFKKLHERLQVLLLFFIEASSYIDDEDLKWNVYLMFKSTGSSDELVGYSTLYPFLFYPDKTRLRLSQFIILPQYHRLGLGSQLYRHIYEQVLSSPEIMELTVEDPSDDFMVFRLSNDYQVFSAFPEPPKRQELKLSEPEYELLTQLDAFKKLNGNEEDKDYRLQVKKALWRRNKETMPDDPEKLKMALQIMHSDRIELFKRVLKF